ncbi:transposase [Clostridium sp. MSJ-4]|uniref:Transposase n=1 Tax=Clostridium simiarum TaxID=2841506 RepID=A0ABS6F2C5_9CLOT|nr:IS3 family transposase [Clostridium simiarum]MBU5592656.1 transposase [Clostridium simiarum]
MLEGLKEECADKEYIHAEGITDEKIKSFLQEVYFVIEDKTPTEYVKEIIKDIHNRSNKVYGSIKIRKKLNEGKNPKVNHKRIERIISKNAIKY